MELNPDEARLLVGVLLDDDESVGGELGDRLAERRAQLGVGEFGRYRLLRLVGTGGMGEVYEAEQDHPRRRVALKVIRADVLSPEAAARFDHEARILGRLQHPGIARIYEAGRNTAQGVAMPYFAMEFVEGRALLDHVRQQHLSVKARLELFVRICEAVEHAHRMGVIHRDLKPGNILVDGAGQPRVLDFGVARATDSDVQATSFQTDMGRLVGTLAYMSPEQVSADPAGLDTRSDVYALGVLLYELLSGRAPYKIDGARIHEAARVITQTEPDPLSTTDRALRGDVQTIVTKALAKERDRRYQSVGELAADIRRYLKDEPIEARPPSAVYQIAKFARRNRGVVMALSVAAATLVAGAGAAAWFAVKERRANSALTASLADATRQRDTAEEMSIFLKNMLMSPNAKYMGRDVRVVDQLERAEKHLDDGGVTSAAAEAGLRQAIGVAYLGLEDFERAEMHISRAIELAETTFGPDDDRTLENRENYALILSQTGRFAEAEAIDRKILNAYQRRDAGAKKICRAMRSLAIDLTHQSKRADAEALLRDAMARAETGLEPDDDLRPAIANELGVLMMERNQLDEAVALLAPAVAELERLTGPNSPATLDAMNNLGITRRKRGELDEAAALYAAIIERGSKQMGPSSLQVLTAKGNLGALLNRQKKHAEAESLFRELVPEAERALGEAHPQVLNFRSTLSRAVASQGRMEDAEVMLRSLCENAASALAPDSEDLALYRRDHGSCLMKLKRFSEAEPLLLEAFESAKSIRGVNYSGTQRSISLLVELYEQMGDAEKAAEYKAMLIPAEKPAESAPRSPGGS